MAKSIIDIKNVKRLVAKLQARRAKVRRDRGSVIVGYTQHYAVYVHENLSSYHAVPTQAKYLEQPARRLANSGVLASVISQIVKAGKTLMQGLLMAGLRIQRESQMIVPVDTGLLRASAFTRIDT